MLLKFWIKLQQNEAKPCKFQTEMKFLGVGQFRIVSTLASSICMPLAVTT